MKPDMGGYSAEHGTPLEDRVIPTGGSPTVCPIQRRNRFYEMFTDLTRRGVSADEAANVAERFYREW
jgi:hypothetical protein